MDVVPTELAVRPPNILFIAWSDGEKREYTFGELRSSCPCATCREKRATQSPNPFQIMPKEAAQEVKVVGLQPVGSYAYSIEFSDKHDTGIYTLEFLRELGKVVES